MGGMTDDALEALEAAVVHALATGDESGIDVIGYGEVTAVLRAETPAGAFACKRLPPFSSRAAAHRCGEVIGRYVAALEAHGMDCVESEVRVLDAPEGRTIAYCVQPMVPTDRLGPNVLRSLDESAATEAFGRILERLRRAVTPTVAPDGQLSNWAFVDDRLVYFDVTTPFLRDETGREELDWRPYMQALPGPARPIVYRWVLPRILDAYHSLRGQVVDFLGNVRKERIEHLIPPLLAYANGELAFEEPITLEQVEAAYKVDALTYARLHAVGRMNRWVHRHLLRRPYPFLLPPGIDRNL